jgi:sec-independent protein translocase protein TatB
MDNILGIGLPELFFIAVIALIVLGPERLPGTLRQIARYWGYMRNLGRELTSQFSEEFKALEDLNPRKILNEMADEELAKDLNIKNVASTKKPAAKTAASAAKSTTTTKPATTAGKPAATKSTTGATVKAPTPAKPAAATKAANDKPATAQSGTAEPTPGASVQNQILPPPVDQSAATAPGENGDSPTSPKPEPAEDAPAEKPVITSPTAAGVVDAADLVEREG